MIPATQHSIFIVCSRLHSNTDAPDCCGCAQRTVTAVSVNMTGVIFSSNYNFGVAQPPRSRRAFYCLSVCCGCSNSGSHDIFIKTFLHLRFLLYSLLHATHRCLPLAACHWHFNVAVTAMTISTFDTRLWLLLLL